MILQQNSTDVRVNYFYDEDNVIQPIDVLYERHIVNPNGLIQLKNIPSPLHTVFTIIRRNGTSVIQYNKVESVVNQYDFMVDYINGILTFHSSQVGKEIQISYTNSIGKLNISADIIFTNIDNQGNIVQTLGTMIDEGRSVLSDLSVFGGASKVITELQGYIESARELTGNIIQGSNINTELKKTTDTAKSTNTTLSSTITNANNKISDLNSWVESHGDIINLDNRVGTAENKLNTVSASLEDIVYLVDKENGQNTEKLKNAITNKRYVLIDREYIVNTPIVLENLDNVKICFNKDGKIKHSTNSVFVFKSCSNITIEGANIEGAYINTEQPIKDFAFIFEGTLDKSCKNIKILNSRFYNETNVLNFYRCKNVEVKNNNFNNIYAFGEFDVFCDNVEISKNIYYGRGGTDGTPIDDIVGGALAMSSRSSNITFTSNKVYNSFGDGAKAEGCVNVIYTDNIIDRFGKDGLKVMHCTHYGAEYNTTSNFTITNNILTNGKKWRTEDSGCITVDGAENGLISNNIITGDGISVKTGIVATTWKYDESPSPKANRNINIINNVITKCTNGISFLTSAEKHIDITVINNKVDSMCRFLDCKSTFVFNDNKILLPYVSNYDYCVEILNCDVSIINGNTFVNGSKNNLYCAGDRIRIVGNEFRFDTPTLNRNCVYTNGSSELKITNNRFTSAYRSITISANNLKVANIIDNVIIDNGDTPITFSNHDTSSNVFNVDTLNISNNAISGYYTNFSNGLGIIWFTMKNYSINNFVFNNNTIVKSAICQKVIYAQNCVYADYQGNAISLLNLGKSVIDNELITLSDLVVGKKI